jgi:hypothetical protein
MARMTLVGINATVGTVCATPRFLNEESWLTEMYSIGQNWEYERELVGQRCS